MIYTTHTILAEIADGAGITLAQAARLLPPGRRGKPVHVSCLLRWCTAGSLAPDGQRVRLEAARAGSRLLTSQAALTRYMAALSGGTSSAPAGAELRTPSARDRATRQAMAQLAADGIA